MIKGAVAIFKRDFKKFMSNPFVMMITMFMPIMYLIVFGNAMGGTITHIPLAVVQEEPAVQDTPLFVSTVEILRNQAQQDNPRTFDITIFTDEQKAKRYLKNGVVKGVVVFPSTVSRDRPVRLYVDSSDYITPTLIQAGVQAALIGAGAHNPVNINKIYGDIKYIQFFGVGVIVMAIFMSTMMGGGIALIKDREMGIIEGYLVTPVKRSSIILGMIGSGTIRAFLAGLIIFIVDILVTGVIVQNMEDFLMVLLVLFITYAFPEHIREISGLRQKCNGWLLLYSPRINQLLCERIFSMKNREAIP